MVTTLNLRGNGSRRCLRSEILLTYFIIVLYLLSKSQGINGNDGPPGAPGIPGCNGTKVSLKKKNKQLDKIKYILIFVSGSTLMHCSLRLILFCLCYRENEEETVVEVFPAFKDHL